jgi:cytosine/uracil/thiamine/allantoin permease
MRHLTSLFLCVGLVGVLALLGAAPLYGQAQSNAVDLSGTVTDPQGAAVAGATVTVRHKATNSSRTTASDAAGGYRFVALPPGVYEVTVEAAGFAPAHRRGQGAVNQRRWKRYQIFQVQRQRGLATAHGVRRT